MKEKNLKPIIMLEKYNIKSIENKCDITEREIDKDIDNSDLIVILKGSIVFRDIKVAIKELEKKNFDIIYVHRYVMENNTTIGAKFKK